MKTTCGILAALCATSSFASPLINKIAPLEPREEGKDNLNGTTNFLIRTDLKQDNDYDREAGGQICDYKQSYLQISGSDVKIVPFKSRSSATKVSTPAPNGIPSDGKFINVVSASEKTEGVTEHKVTVDAQPKSNPYFYTLPEFGNEVKASNDKPDYKGPVFDTWLLCVKEGDGKSGKGAVLRWLAPENGGLTIPFPKCRAVRLYAEPEDTAYTPTAEDKKYCPGNFD